MVLLEVLTVVGVLAVLVKELLTVPIQKTPGPDRTDRPIRPKGLVHYLSRDRSLSR
jgi:hypothetical protein